MSYLKQNKKVVFELKLKYNEKQNVKNKINALFINMVILIQL